MPMSLRLEQMKFPVLVAVITWIATLRTSEINVCSIMGRTEPENSKLECCANFSKEYVSRIGLDRISRIKDLVILPRNCSRILGVPNSWILGSLVARFTPKWPLLSMQGDAVWQLTGARC